MLLLQKQEKPDSHATDDSKDPEQPGRLWYRACRCGLPAAVKDDLVISIPLEIALESWSDLQAWSITLQSSFVLFDGCKYSFFIEDASTQCNGGQDSRTVWMELRRS